jgi:flagellar motor protein MotB
MSPNGLEPDLLSAIPAPTETPQPPWLMSFADFVSCLLACFVLLYSLVAVDRAKFDKMLEGMPGRQVVEDIPGSADRAMLVAPVDDARNADYLASVIRA